MVYSLLKNKEKYVRLNNAILTKVKVKSINDVALPAGNKNMLKDIEIRLGAVYVCDYAHDEIMETFFKRIIKLQWIDF